MSITTKDFPKRLYVYLEEDGKEKYIFACRTDKECADLNGSKVVAIYNLETIGKLETSVLMLKWNSRPTRHTG